MDAAADEYLDDGEFDEYNPHPYAGGYDIAATYGAPLPPSPATCYPVSSPAAVVAPTAPQQPSPLPPPPALADPPRPPPAAPAEPHYWPEPHDYGDAPRDHQPMYATPEVFRGWPFLPRPHCGCGRFWRQCLRGLDYLFGHSDGYGERRIGVDNFGVPVYANRKEGVEDSVVFQVAPPATGTVEWHDAGEEPYQSNRLSWYDDTEEEANVNAHTTYNSYDRPYEQYYSYGVSDENAWFPNHNYQELYREEGSQYQDFLYYDAYRTISSQPIFSYNQHYGEQPMHIYVEPPETASSHRLEYYEDFSTYANQNNVYDLEGSRYSNELQPCEYTPNEQIEPYRPSWSLNLGYYEACTDGMSPEYDNRTLGTDDCWDMSSLFVSPFYPQEPQIYEHSYGDENV